MEEKSKLKRLNGLVGRMTPRNIHKGVNYDKFLVLSERDRKIFFDALINPPAPSERLKHDLHVMRLAAREVTKEIRSARIALKSALKSSKSIRSKKPHHSGLGKNEVISQPNRITRNPKIRGGKPIVRGLRITVGDVLECMASGMTEKQIMKNFPELTHEEILACLAYAAARMK